MILSNKKFENFTNKVGNYYFKLDKGDILLHKESKIFIFNGYLYPDISYGIDDLFNHLQYNVSLINLKKFKGRYCGVFIDTDKNSLTIFNDQLGLKDIFYYYKGGVIFLSNKFVNFLSNQIFTKEDLDIVALAEFLLYQHVFLDRTFIKDIKLLRYATVKRFFLDNSKIKEKHYWRYTLSNPLNFNRADAMERLDFLFKQSAHRIHLLNKKDFVVGLSGGLDSRLVAKYCLNEKMNLESFVFANNCSDSLYISKLISNVLNIPLKQLIISGDYWKWANKHINYDPMMNIIYTSYYSIFNNLDPNKVMLTGFYGGELFGNHLRKNFNRFISKYKLTNLSIIDKEIINNINKDINYITKSYGDDESRSMAFDFVFRQLRFIKNSPSFNYYGLFEDNFSLFTDIDLIEFGLSLPKKELYHCKFYHDFIRKYHPELAKIRSESYPFSLKDHFLIRTSKNFLLRLKKFIHKQFNLTLPLFRDINSNVGGIDRDYLFNCVNFEKEFEDININGINSSKINSLRPRGIENISIKFQYLTILKFIQKYIH